MKRGYLLVALAMSLFLLAGANCKKKTEDTPVADASAKSGGVEKGKALYTSNACGSCHGDSGMGDGIAGKALKPPPRDLTKAAGYKQGATVAEIAKTIEKGVPNTLMVAYPHIPAGDRTAIAEFIKSLQK